MLILYENYHGVWQITLTLIIILYIFNFWELLYVTKMFINCLAFTYIIYWAFQ
jgi:hypothetical protein